MTDKHAVEAILERARQAAVEYYDMTGKPLGITGEMGEYLAAKFLDLKLADAREPGYDAIDKKKRKIQIKARCIPEHKRIVGQRVGGIKLDHEWDSVMLVLMNERFEPLWIYEADRAPIEAAILKPDSRARNECQQRSEYPLKPAD
jgi:hypothetical protein